MDHKTRWIVIGVSAAALVAGGASIAIAAAIDDDQALTGTTLDRATAAALEHTNGGTVTETEVGDDGAAYGVEVRLDSGDQVEVNLDADFNVIGEEADDDGAGDEDGATDD